MKKTAFLHALLIVMLLTASWLLFVVRLKNNPVTQNLEEQQQDEKEIQEILTDPQSETPPIEQESLPVGTVQNKQFVPTAWIEWIEYLESQQSARDMRFALDAMRDTLFSMESGEGLARLLELINSGVNVKTGLMFQVGRNGELAGAPDLHTLLLDWLSRMDPERAAQLAKFSLAQQGESLGPDAFVVHLKNYARGTTDPNLNRNQLVRSYFDRLVSNPEWTNQPAHSIAESMDFAVFLQDGSIVPVLSGFMADGRPPALGHASSMAIERLVDIDPVGSLSAMIDTIGQSGMSSYARAGFVARVDPAGPGGFQLLTAYLQHPSVTRQEAITFLQFLPNLNKTLSYNLVSPEISITELGNHLDRLSSALSAVQEWQSNPVRNDLEQQLSQTEQRLLSQINGEPAP